MGAGDGGGRGGVGAVADVEFHKYAVEMRAYDSLPPVLRRLLAGAPVNLSARFVADLMAQRGAGAAEAALRGTIQRQCPEGKGPLP